MCYYEKENGGRYYSIGRLGTITANLLSTIITVLGKIPYSRYCTESSNECTRYCSTKTAVCRSNVMGVHCHVGVINRDGKVSIMGRLDCKEPSHLALYCLAKEADFFMTLTDREVLESIEVLENYGLSTSASGGAGFAGLHRALISSECELSSDSRVLLFLSEGKADD